MEFGDVFRLGSKLNEWFLSLDLRQLRATFFTQTVAPCRVELSDDEGDDDLEGELHEDGWSTLADGTSARSTSTSHTQGATHGEPNGVAPRPNQCFWCGSAHASIETTSKHMAAAERHNDAGRFRCPVIDIPPDTICPRDTAELQRHSASTEYPPPEGHASVINAETSDSASGGNPWQKIRDRWRARRAERETKTHQTAAWRAEGRRDDEGHELGVERARQGQTHRHEAAQRRPQDSLRPITTSSGSQRRSLHVG